MSRDRWAEWLLQRRHGGDAERLRRVLESLGERRDLVLDHAEIHPGDTVLDVGCGDGLLGFGALERVGPVGRVIFSDHSPDLLERCRELAAELAVTDRCEFVPAALPELPAIADASVDVAMTRSVLIYVDDKAGAFRSLHRVLRPSGRLSIFEPINRFGLRLEPNRLWGVDFTGLEAIAEKVEQAREPHAVPPMMDFDERDLLDSALTPQEQEAMRERFITSPREHRLAVAYLWGRR